MRIGIIGCSGHYHHVLDGMSELPDACLCAVAPGCPDEDCSDALAYPEMARHSPSFYSDYRQMLDLEKLDVVAVNPFYYLHSNITVEALSRGLHVYCEKPLALTHEALAQVRQAQVESGKQIGIMLAFRYDPRFYTAHRLVRAGAIGQPAVGYSQKSYKLGVRPWFYNRRETFGGLIPWVGIHAIDWFRWVSGVELTAVRAYHTNLHACQYPGMEDAATCLFELSNGGTAVMSFDFLRPPGAPSHGDDRLRLVGSQGVLEINDSVDLNLIDKEGPMTVEIQKPEYGPFADFALSVMQGRECLIPTGEALGITEIALLSRDAADTGERIELL